MQTLSDITDRARNYDLELPAPPAALVPPQGAEIARWIDHTLLKPEATVDQIKNLCFEAIQYDFASVCVNSVYVPLAAEMLKDSHVDVCCTIGFPFGATSSSVKLFETLGCIQAGAKEIDMVIHIGALKGGLLGQVYNEIMVLAQVCHSQNAILKVILEMASLTHQEKIIGCLISQAAGADFVKTSTGYGPGGATIEDVELMYRVVGKKTKIKAAGGIRNLKNSLDMIGAGASRLGASAGVQIVQEAVAQY